MKLYVDLELVSDDMFLASEKQNARRPGWPRAHVPLSILIYIAGVPPCQAILDGAKSL